MQGPPPSIDPRDESSPKTETTRMNVDARMIIGGLVYFLYALGAAKLGYEHYGSVLVAIVAFLLAPFFYMFYAFAVGGKVAPPPLLMGGRRRR
jgi:hypothetical protein